VYPRTLDEACKNRDNLAKNLYSRLFSWLIKTLNSKLSSDSAKKQAAFNISLLDMFGFENLKSKNGLDQLLVNTANEQLHAEFNRNLIERNHHAYQQEGLNYHQVNYKDNKKTMDLLLQKPIGLLNILKDSCKVASHKGEDQLLVQNLKEYFGHCSEFIPTRSGEISFGVEHIGGKVKYDARNFVDQAKETIGMNVFECLQKSGDNFVADLFKA